MLEVVSEHACFGGVQGFYSHQSATIGLPMRFSVYQPPQAKSGPVPVLFFLAGLTCTEETFMIKAGAQRLAAEYGLMLVATDTSPRNTGIEGATKDWDFGEGAGFYLDATAAPWNKHFRMETWVVEELRELILTRQVPVGGRLPPERDLALSLGVSRPSLREALIALEISGHVEIRGGSGLYACLPVEPTERALPASLGESPSEVMQARAMLESAVVMLAAARTTPAALARLRECLDGMRVDLAHKRVPVDNDRAFHVAIAEMTGNSVVVRIVGDLFDDRHSPLAAHVSVRAESLRTWRAAVDEHEAVLRALEAREPQAAAAAMATHLRASEVRWLGT